MELMLEPRAESSCEIEMSLIKTHYVSLADRNAESLLDICHDTNFSPTDMTVTQNQNVLLRSVSSSEVRCSS